MRPLLVLAVVVALFAAGCSGPEALPRTTVSVQEDPVPQDGKVVVVVSFKNDSGLSFPYRTGSCQTYRVWTEVDGNSIAFRPDHQVDCLEPAANRTLEPGRRLPPGRFSLDLETHKRSDGTPLFVTGGYRVQGQVLGRGDAWDTTTAATFTVEEALPRIQVEATQARAEAGEPRRFLVTFANTADRAFTFTSSNGCIGFEVRVHDIDGQGGHVRADEDPPRSCTEALTPFSIAPGESVVQEYVWDGTVDGASPAPGSYQVTARFDGTDRAWDASGETTLHIVEPS